MSAAIKDAHDGWSHQASPFHAGEQAIQERLGLREAIESFGRRVVRDFMPEQHRDFFSHLPFVAVGSVDSEGRPWASLLTGRPGFIVSPDPQRLFVKAVPHPDDPLSEGLGEGRSLGMLGLDFATRRRNRVNVRVSSRKEEGLDLTVEQSFGNCPQYIQARSFSFVRDPEAPVAAQAARFERLDEEARAMIAAADTLFVASAYEADGDRRREGADVSHRGGRPGFVRVEQTPEGDRLTLPDFAGNGHFNTLGNFLLNPRAGLTFVDFESGDLLMLTGRVEIIWDGPEVEAFRGAERAWRFTVTQGLRLRKAVALRWDFGAFSPNALATGDWQEAEAALAVEAQRDTWRSYRVSRIEDESSVIRSFYLEPEDTADLPGFKAGQYLTIRVTPEAGAAPAVRTYTLSSAPSDRFYRISVKREDAGLVSKFLHDRISVGDRIEARAPRGGFTFDTAEKRPAVLLAGGVGITPMIAMLRQALSEGRRTRQPRSVTLIHSAQTTSQRAFFKKIKEISAASEGLIRSFSFIDRPGGKEIAGRDFHGKGFITAAALKEILPLDDYDFFLCGPPAFMQGLYDTLRSLGVSDGRILAEAFGPAALVRRPEKALESATAEKAESALVAFTESGLEEQWTPESGSLLDFAEAQGLQLEFGCRNGACGMCATKITAGSVAYRHTPSAATREDEALICCAVPAKNDKGENRLELAL